MDVAIWEISEIWSQETQITQLPLRSLSPNSWPAGNLIRANDLKSESSRTLVWNQEPRERERDHPGQSKPHERSEIKPAEDEEPLCGPCYDDNTALAGFRKCWARPKLGPGYFLTQDVLVSATINQHFLRKNQIECKYLGGSEIVSGITSYKRMALQIILKSWKEFKSLAAEFYVVIV